MYPLPSLLTFKYVSLFQYIFFMYFIEYLYLDYFNTILKKSIPNSNLQKFVYNFTIIYLSLIDKCFCKINICHQIKIIAHVC